jgi:hypothetical protein
VAEVRRSTSAFLEQLPRSAAVSCESAHGEVRPKRSAHAPRRKIEEATQSAPRRAPPHVQETQLLDPRDLHSVRPVSVQPYNA